MSGQTQPELIPFTSIDPDHRRDAERAAAVHVADRIGAEHPHPLDELMPRLAGRLIAQDPVVMAGVRELLDLLGLDKSHTGRPS